MLSPSRHTPIMKTSCNMKYLAHLVVEAETILVFDNAKTFGLPMSCSTQILRVRILLFSAFCSSESSRPFGFFVGGMITAFASLHS